MCIRNKCSSKHCFGVSCTVDTFNKDGWSQFEISATNMADKTLQIATNPTLCCIPAKTSKRPNAGVYVRNGPASVQLCPRYSVRVQTEPAAAIKHLLNESYQWWLPHYHTPCFPAGFSNSEEKAAGKSAADGDDTGGPFIQQGAKSVQRGTCRVQRWFSAGCILF